jgi:hypothetical protein
MEKTHLDEIGKIESRQPDLSGKIADHDGRRVTGAADVGKSVA